MFKIFDFLFVLFFIKNHVTTASNDTCKILFMSPKDSNQEIQLNNLPEFSRQKIQKGWYLKENEIHTFFLYVLNDTLKITKSKIVHETVIRRVRDTVKQNEKHSFYLYFTLDPNSCNDYLNYTHIPIRITNSLKKKNILKFEFSFSLKYALTPYYICLSKPYESLIDREAMLFFHQGTDSHLSILTYSEGYPISFKMLIYVILVFMNSVFNGLNLGLMSLSIEELEMLIKTSDSLMERKYARNILPLRKKGNFLLCSILLSIAMTSSVSTLVLDNLLNGFLAGVISTITLCIIGEITPQAICSRFSLPIGSYTRNFTYFFLYLTSIVSYPLSKLVDFVLGEEIPTKYNRDIIKELIKKSRGLKEKQCQIISGILDSKEKIVGDIMTDIDQVYMIHEDEKLNFEIIAAIYNSGYSRIPVYRGEKRGNIIGLFHVKDMTLIDPDAEISVKELIQIYKHKIFFCHRKNTLREIFDIFSKGTTHIAFVLESLNTKKCTEDNECIGVVTFHDVIEALFQFKISDEFKTKRYGINYLKKIVENKKRHSFTQLKNDEKIKIRSSPTISLQTKFILMQILTNIKPFSDEFIDKAIIEKLVENDENYFCKYLSFYNKSEAKFEQSKYLFKYGEEVDYFILLIEGSFMIEAGIEKTEFYTRQFEHFGEQALLGECENVSEVLKKILDNSKTSKPYIPEFSLKIHTDSLVCLNEHNMTNIIYLKIDRNTWLAAVKATSLKRIKNEN
ncbi:unnamed protein product [Brachionus calyciflorus]|uniref:Uncharacterized protein n=1 Tax=Brachionus calyciflorus TaxID=104777 RepID=A0A813XXA2_9BILA|nr:unnamed protein product [Brachionus calyciflorus]